MEICNALPDAFLGSDKYNEESTKKQAQLFLEEVMQEVEIVMDDLSAITQNVTIKLSSTITEFDARFYPSSSYSLQAQVQNFLDDIIMDVDKQISSRYLAIPDLNEVKVDDDLIDDSPNAINICEQVLVPDNEVKVVMNNILGNLKDLLCQEENKCAPDKIDDALPESKTLKRKVTDYEIEPDMEKVGPSIMPQDILMGDEEASTVEELQIKQKDFEKRFCETADVVSSENSKIPPPKCEETHINVTCLPPKISKEVEEDIDTPKISKEAQDNTLSLTKEQNEYDKKESFPLSGKSEVLPELRYKQPSQNVCKDDSACTPQVLNMKNQENESLEICETDDEALKLQLPIDTEITLENTTHILMKNHLQTEGSQKRHMQGTLSASPETKQKVSGLQNDQKSLSTSSTPNLMIDHLQTEGSQIGIMQDTLSASPEKKQEVSDLQNDQNSPSTSSSPTSMKDHLKIEASQKRHMQDTLSPSPEKKQKVSDLQDIQKDKNSPSTYSSPISMEDDLETGGSQKRDIQDTWSATPKKRAKIFDSESLKDQNSQSTSSPNSSSVSPEQEANIFEPLKDQNSSQTFSAPDSPLIQSLHLNGSVPPDKEKNDTISPENFEVKIQNNIEHREEDIDIAKRKNEDQTVPSLMPPEESTQQSGNDIEAEASLYSSVGNNEKVEEKLQCEASDKLSHKVTLKTPNDDSGRQTCEKDTGSQMVPSSQDSDAVTDILQTLQYHSQQPTTAIPPLLMPVFNVGQQKATGPLERLPPIPACTRRTRVGLSRRQAIPRLHSVTRELKPLVPKETEQ